MSMNLIGCGWCRPNCIIRSASCRLNSYLKKESNYEECRAYCYDESLCSGFAISAPTYAYPNRCFLYGNISSEIITSSNGWTAYPKNSYAPVVSKASGHKGVRCFKRTGITVARKFYAFILNTRDNNLIE